MATKQIVIKPIEFGYLDVVIAGDTPLIIHAWSEKAKREMLDKQMGKKVTAKHELKNPVNDFMDSLYWLTQKPEHGSDPEESSANVTKAFDEGAKFGFPCNGIKASIISGAYRAGLDVTMASLRGTFFIEGATEASTVDLAEIVAPYPESREDMVRVGGMSKSADIRYRAEFKDWKIPMRIKYIKDGKYSLDQIVNMVNYGGFVTGIGEWRPEKDGQFGMYHLEDISVVQD